MKLYPYADGDKLESPNTYFYSSYHGTEFLRAWMAGRDVALSELPKPGAPPRPRGRLPENPPYVLQELIHGILAVVGQGAADAEARALWLLTNLVRRYEVAKRLHDSYSAEFKPAGSACPPPVYIGFGEGLAYAYRHTESLLYLNALLKVVDMLISIRSRLLASDGSRLAWLIMDERQAVHRLAEKKSVCLEY